MSARRLLGTSELAVSKSATGSSTPHSPRTPSNDLGLQADAASGGGPGGTLKDFYPLFPKFAYFTEASINAPINIIDAFPSITIQPTRDFAVTAGVDILWRYSTRDGFYQPPGVPLVLSSANTNRFLGEQYNLHAEWQATAHINVNAVYVHFTPAGFLKSAGAKGIDYPRHMGRPRCFEHPIAFGHREVLIRGYVHGVVICCGAQDDRHGGISIAHAASNASEKRSSG